MADNAIVFACANPIPEIWPWEAKEAGAKVVATGRSDFPNQVNNSIGFPAIFRGTLDVMAKTITDEMCIAAAVELARCAEDKGISENLPAAHDGRVGGLPQGGCRGREEGDGAGRRPPEAEREGAFLDGRGEDQEGEGRGRYPYGERHHPGI